MKTNKQICKVRRAKLGFEDHGVLIAGIEVDYGNCSQFIGGFCLSNCVYDDKPCVTTPLAMDFVVGVMRAAGVGSWEDLPGRTLYAIFPGDDMPLNTMPLGLAPLSTEEGVEFIFADWQSKVKAAQR